MHTKKVIEGLEKIRNKYKLERADEDIIKVAKHKLAGYQKIVNFFSIQ